MPDGPVFKEASAYVGDVLSLPVADTDAAAAWYAASFGFEEADRSHAPHDTVIMERDGVRIGFAKNGGDSSQNGAAILVRDIAAIRDELEGNGVSTANWRIDERDGRKYRVFFVVAPDGLCYYFHEPLDT